MPTVYEIFEKKKKIEIVEIYIIIQITLLLTRYYHLSINCFLCVFLCVLSLSLKVITILNLFKGIVDDH